MVARKFGQGPNKYPEELSNPAEFRKVVDDYHTALTSLAMGILQMLARTLDLEDNAFSEFGQYPVAVLRLLHYPPQEPDASELERGKFLDLRHPVFADEMPQESVPTQISALLRSCYKTLPAAYRCGTTFLQNGLMSHPSQGPM